MATKRSGKPLKGSKNRPKRIPSVKRIEPVRPLRVSPGGNCCPNNTYIAQE